MLTYDKSKCCGCTACESICPKKAITMEVDGMGSLYPKVDANKCIDCGLCDEVCTYKNIESSNDKKFYIAINNDNEVRSKSSSGGVFFEIAKYVINNGGVVFGCAVKGKDVFHTYAVSLDDCNMFCGSKYTESRLGNTYKQVKEFLMEGRKVLFTGTPCQVNGLKLFLRKEYLNLITLDFICHGTPLRKVYRKYIDELEEEYKSNVINVSFRDKTFGWTKFAMKIDFANGRTYIKDLTKDVYLKIFLSDIALKDSCYQCSANGDNRRSDITIADFWGIQNIEPKFFDDKGASIIITNNLCGETIFDLIKQKFTYKEISKDQALISNSAYSKSVSPNKHREKFLRNLDHYSLDKLVRKYCSTSLTKRVFNKLKKLISSIFRS